MDDQIEERWVRIFGDAVLNDNQVAQNASDRVARAKRGQSFVNPKTEAIQVVQS
jgi:hypothetical protein